MTLNSNFYEPTPTAEANRPTSQVKEQLDNLAARLEHLHENLARLEHRLQPVLILKGEGGEVKMKQQDEPPLLVPLASEIRDRSLSLSIAIYHIDSLIARMEI